MKIEFRAHYWPNTPELREIKLVLDDNIIQSQFMNIEQINDLIQRLEYIQESLSRTVDDIDKDFNHGTIR